jgi:hypothetical protein
VASNADFAAEAGRRGPRSAWLTILAVYSWLLAIITFFPQLYYVLFAMQPHLIPIGPNSNPLGQVWYYYILGGHQGSHLQVDPGTLAGAIEDAYMLGPLYLITGFGLWQRRAWVVPVGLVTGAMIIYADLYFLLSGVLDQHPDLTDTVTTVESSIPYLVYPLWLVPTVLFRRSNVVGGPSSRPATGARLPQGDVSDGEAGRRI